MLFVVLRLLLKVLGFVVCVWDWDLPAGLLCSVFRVLIGGLRFGSLRLDCVLCCLLLI